MITFNRNPEAWSAWKTAQGLHRDGSEDRRASLATCLEFSHYRLWLQDWKTEYKHLSSVIRVMKQERRLAAREERWGDLYYFELGLSLGRKHARNMLELRHEAKTTGTALYAAKNEALAK
jgi:hypothetical protein